MPVETLTGGHVRFVHTKGTARRDIEFEQSIEEGYTSYQERKKRERKRLILLLLLLGILTLAVALFFLQMYS